MNKFVLSRKKSFIFGKIFNYGEHNVWWSFSWKTFPLSFQNEIFWWKLAKIIQRGWFFFQKAFVKEKMSNSSNNSLYNWNFCGGTNFTQWWTQTIIWKAMFSECFFKCVFDWNWLNENKALKRIKLE